MDNANSSYANETALRKLIHTADVNTLRKVWKSLAGALAARKGTTVAAYARFARAEHATNRTDIPAHYTAREMTGQLFEAVRNETYVQIDTGRKEWVAGHFGHRTLEKVYRTDPTASEAIFAAALEVL